MQRGLAFGKYQGCVLFVLKFFIGIFRSLTYSNLECQTQKHSREFLLSSNTKLALQTANHMQANRIPLSQEIRNIVVIENLPADVDDVSEAGQMLGCRRQMNVTSEDVFFFHFKQAFEG
jgi:hypothetical protein